MKITEENVPEIIEANLSLAEAYLAAGKALLGDWTASSSRRLESAALYPIAHALRQSLEVALKAVVFGLMAHRGGSLQRYHAALFSPRGLPHLLRTLLSEVRRSRFTALFPDDMLKRIDQVAELFYKAELNSSIGFRYPSVMTGQVRDIPLGNLTLLQSDVEAIVRFLVGVSNSLAAAGYPGCSPAPLNGDAAPQQQDASVTGCAGGGVVL